MKDAIKAHDIQENLYTGNRHVRLDKGTGAPIHSERSPLRHSIEDIIDEIHNARVEYACDTPYIIKSYMTENEFDGERYLISDDGTEHCGYLVVEGCSFGTFWFDLYKGAWESKDGDVQKYLNDPSVKAELNKLSSEVAKCLGPQASAVDEMEVWRKIISLHIRGDYSLSPEIDIMTLNKNASAKTPATVSKRNDKSWDIKSLDAVLCIEGKKV